MAKEVKQYYDPVNFSQALKELKNLTAPPADVKTVIDTTMRLLGYNEAYIKHYKNVLREMKKSIGKDSFENSLKNIDIDNISKEEVIRARIMLKDISKERLRKCSLSGTILYSWVESIVDEYENRHGKVPDSIPVADADVPP